VGHITRTTWFPSNDDTLASSPPRHLAFQEFLGGIRVTTMGSSNGRRTFTYRPLRRMTNHGGTQPMLDVLMRLGGSRPLQKWTSITSKRLLGSAWNTNPNAWGTNIAKCIAAYRSKCDNAQGVRRRSHDHEPMLQRTHASALSQSLHDHQNARGLLSGS
jgi:hypothetical protein